MYNNQKNTPDFKFRSCNINYIYNVEYYKGYTANDFIRPKEVTFAHEKNAALLHMKSPEVPSLEGISTHSVILKTTYPGLLTGVGTLHQVGFKNEFSLGFTFDYVTGALYIPGSTVKGILKSAFRHEEIIKNFFNNQSLDVENLSRNIFDGIYVDKDGIEKKVPRLERDVFFDAFTAKSNEIFLDEDFLSPHGNDLTKNPVPIRFLKAKPDVELKFCFNLKDFNKNDLFISKDEKCKLFEELLKLMGVGSKTNVGYGVLK